MRRDLRTSLYSRERFRARGNNSAQYLPCIAVIAARQVLYDASRSVKFRHDIIVHVQQSTDCDEEKLTREKGRVPCAPPVIY